MVNRFDWTNVTSCRGGEDETFIACMYMHVKVNYVWYKYITSLMRVAIIMEITHVCMYL